MRHGGFRALFRRVLLLRSASMGSRTRDGVSALAAVLVVAGLSLVNHTTLAETTSTRSPLHAAVVGVDQHGDRVALAEAGLRRLVPGTRALDERAAEAQRDWLDSGRVPGAGTRWEPMVHDALLDLHVLTLPIEPNDAGESNDSGDSTENEAREAAAVAGWAERWRYVWPRDAAFVAAAYARSGHPADAEAVLTFLQRVQPESGHLQARYLPDGSGGVPDQRGEEPDGPGWTLWSLAVLANSLEDTTARHDLLTRLRPLLIRSTRACLDLVDAGNGLPAPGLDYWEIRSRRATLGIAAPTLVGLEAAAQLLPTVGDETLATSAAGTARALDRKITRIFGPRGYPREVRGSAHDAALTFLMPPFRDAVPPPALTAAWRAAQRQMRRPAGGLAPGSSWRQDGVSWTPETALFALTAASTSQIRTAQQWLAWLDAHRTAGGSLPEKVLADGSPAAVAPLAWTAALVVLTVDSLDRSAHSPVTTG